jgi:hypothetical protein
MDPQPLAGTIANSPFNRRLATLRVLKQIGFTIR